MKMKMFGFLLVVGLCLNQVQGQDSCLDMPSDESCADYVYPDANATYDMDRLCQAMPYMSGCSIRETCLQSHQDETFCDPFSLVADVCAFDMPGMSGCTNYKKLCSPVDSVIQQCDEFPPIPSLPSTTYINTAIKDMCNSHLMEACIECDISSSGYMNCDLLHVYSQLCLSMPDMLECDQWRDMCEYGIPDWPEYCPSSSGQQPPIMRMYFHTGIVDYILFKNWVARTDLQYVGSMIAIVLMGIVFEALQSYRAYLEWKWANANGSINGEKMPLVTDLSNFAQYTVAPFNFYVDVTRGLLYAVEVALAYFLMLIAMTYNVGLFIAVLVGFFLGNVIFARFRKYTPRSCCA